MNRIVASFGAVLLAAYMALHVQGQTPVIQVQANQPGAAVTPYQFGIFFEDINFGADGGIYAELIKNRSFEFPTALMGWSQSGAQGSARVLERENQSTNNRHYLQLNATASGFGITNSGFRGIGVEQGKEYSFSLQAQNNGSPVTLRIEFVNASGKVIGQAKVGNIKGDWKPYRATIRATGTDAKAKLNVVAETPGTVALDMISLFPKTTWKGRPNGLRADLVKLLADMKPGFIRFPGGCIVEGRTLAERYQWKTTIGEVAERKLLINRWNMEFRTRNPERAPDDYFQSFGLGFFEYFQLCEDVGAEPLPILNCGMACQFNTGELAPLDQLDPYIQDALDLIEFANGSVASTWGRKRAELGHPAPFNMKLLGVGNEQWGPDYIPRYEAFAKAIKAKYPNIQLVTSAGPSPSGDRFEFLWKQFRGLNADLVDEHFYQSPKWFYDNVHRYDNYPRTGPKVFAGEYAGHVSVKGRPDKPNNWEAALAEAAFLTGVERNSDVVTMASYAPLFGHVDAWQWSPNLIWFDNLRSFGTPSYYVQKLFASHHGTNVLPVHVNGEAKQVYASALRDAKTNDVIVKLVNAGTAATEVRLNLAGARVTKAGKAIVLTSSDLAAENSLAAPTKVAPTEQPLKVSGPEFNHSLPPQSVTVLRVNCAK